MKRSPRKGATDRSFVVALSRGLDRIEPGLPDAREIERCVAIAQPLSPRLDGAVERFHEIAAGIEAQHSRHTGRRIMRIQFQHRDLLAAATGVAENVVHLLPQQIAVRQASEAVVLVEEGSMWIEIDGQRTTAEPGRAVIVPAMVPAGNTRSYQSLESSSPVTSCIAPVRVAGSAYMYEMREPITSVRSPSFTFRPAISISKTGRFSTRSVNRLLPSPAASPSEHFASSTG